MGRHRRFITLGLSAAALAATSVIGEWAGSSVVYDPFWHDHHRWNPGENRRYQEWETASSRDHMAFSDRTPGDQLAYWDWRHSGTGEGLRLVASAVKAAAH